MKFSALIIVLALGLGSLSWARVPADPSATEIPSRKLAQRHHAHPADRHAAHAADRHAAHTADKHKAHPAFERHGSHPTDRHHKQHSGE